MGTSHNLGGIKSRARWPFRHTRARPDVESIRTPVHVRTGGALQRISVHRFLLYLSERYSRKTRYRPRPRRAEGREQGPRKRTKIESEGGLRESIRARRRSEICNGFVGGVVLSGNDSANRFPDARFPLAAEGSMRGWPSSCAYKNSAQRINGTLNLGRNHRTPGGEVSSDARLRRDQRISASSGGAGAGCWPECVGARCTKRTSSEGGSEGMVVTWPRAGRCTMAAGRHPRPLLHGVRARHTLRGCDTVAGGRRTRGCFHGFSLRVGCFYSADQFTPLTRAVLTCRCRRFQNSRRFHDERKLRRH